MPSCLIETAFISNEEDLNLLLNKMNENNILEDSGYNYIPIRFLEQLGYNIDFKNEVVIINYK